VARPPQVGGQSEFNFEWADFPGWCLVLPDAPAKTTVLLGGASSPQACPLARLTALATKKCLPDRPKRRHWIGRWQKQIAYMHLRYLLIG